jgi:tetratricopeptide (TPR) repeat protein
MEALKKAATLEPSNEAVWLNIGRIAERLGRKSDALSAFKSYLDKHPQGAHAEYARGRIKTLLASN